MSRADILRAGMEDYIAINPSRPRDDPTLQAHLGHYPEFSPPVDLIPMDELEQRLDIAYAIQKHVQMSEPESEWQLTAVHLSVLMVMPLDLLHATKNKLVVENPDHLIDDLNAIHSLTSHFFQVLSESAKENIAQSRKNRTLGSAGSKHKATKSSTGKRKDRSDEAYIPNMGPKSSVRRDEKEIKACLDREKTLCLVSQWGEPDACHIVPFAFTSNDENMTVTSALIKGSYSLFGTEAASLTRLICGNLGASDKAWNMLALSPNAHRGWSRGYFGFECKGLVPGTSSTAIILQMRWMVRSNIKGLNAKHPVDLENDRESASDDLRYYSQPPASPCAFSTKSGGGMVYFTWSESCLKVRAGDLFKIEMAHEDAVNMKSMIDFQWAMVRILALSGAAGAPELFGEPDPDQIGLQMSTMEPVGAISEAELSGHEGGSPTAPKKIPQLPPPTAQQTSPRLEPHLGSGPSVNIPFRPSVGRQSRAPSPEKITSPVSPKPLTGTVEPESSTSQTRRPTVRLPKSPASRSLSKASPTRSSHLGSPTRSPERSPERSPQRNENQRP